MKKKSKSIPQCLGEFVGHIWKAIKTNSPSSSSTEETIIFRRTITEEIEMPKKIIHEQKRFEK